MQVFQISVSSTYGVPEFKENLLALYDKAGARGPSARGLCHGEARLTACMRHAGCK